MTQINRRFLAQTSFDSAALSPLATIVHRTAQAGDFIGEVTLGKKPVGRFQLTVSKNSKQEQADIDLSAIQRDGNKSFDVQVDGAALFYVTQGAGGYSVRLLNEKDKSVAFDSRKLGKDDAFAVVMLQPGSYESTVGTLKERLTVRAVKPEGDRRHQIPEPIVRDFAKAKATATERESTSGQTRVFLPRGEGRVIVKLVESKVKSVEPKSNRPKKIRWEKGQ